MNYSSILIVFSLGLFLINCDGVKSKNPNEIDYEAIWGNITPYFNPPKEYSNKYGSYRSPLLFYNGDTVRTKNDWQKRRAEIRSRWMNLMGEWPP